MFKNLTQFAHLLRSASQISQRIRQLKSQLGSARIEKGSPDGMVQVAMTGLGQVETIRLAADLLGALSQADREQLQVQLEQAMNAAIREARRQHIEGIKEIAAGMKLTGMEDILAELDD